MMIARLRAALCILLLTACTTPQGERPQEPASTDAGSTDSGGSGTADSGGSTDDSGNGWFDAHVHLRSELRIDDFVALQDEMHMDKMLLLSLARMKNLSTGGIPSDNAVGFLAMVRHPKRFRMFGGVDLSILMTPARPDVATDLSRQVTALADIGVDGLKLLMRTDVVDGLAASPTKFEFLPDAPEVQPALKVAEARGLTVLLHLDQKYTVEHGLPMMGLYPNLTVILTHMGAPYPGHLSLTQLASALDRSSKLFLDIGGSSQLQQYLRDERDATRDFFIRYADRIVVGTDIGAGCEEDASDAECPVEHVARNQAVGMRALLETDQLVELNGVFGRLSVRGMALPPDVLHRIYRGNLDRILGLKPRPLSCPKIVAAVDELIAHTREEAGLTRLRAIRAEIAAVASCP